MNRPLKVETAHRVLDLACAIQQVPGPTFHEEPRARFAEERFKRLKLKDVQRDGAGNVLARLPAGKGGRRDPRPLLVSAHLDTVHPDGSQLDLRREPDRLVGRAIGDNSLGLAALLSLPEMLAEAQVSLERDVWLVANTGEEGLGDLRGMKFLVDRFASRPVAYLVVEGMGLGNVLHRGLGVERYKISVSTRGGHSWVDYGRPSAIHELCRLVAALAEISLPRHPVTTLNVGVIQGGNSVNSIAALAWCELDLRSENAQALAELVEQVQALVSVAAKEDVQVSSERIGRRLAGALPEDHFLVKTACAVLRHLGIEPRLDIASTDSNLPLSRGFPSVCIGITHGEHAHSPEEFILTEPVGLGLAQLVELTARLCQ